MTTTITLRSIPEIKDDVRRYGERLHLDCVKASGRWYAETEAKLAAAEKELAATERIAKLQAKGAADAAWLDAVQGIAPYISTRAGVR